MNLSSRSLKTEANVVVSECTACYRVWSFVKLCVIIFYILFGVGCFDTQSIRLVRALTTVSSVLTDAVFAVDSEEMTGTAAALVTTDRVGTDVLTAAVVDRTLVYICIHAHSWVSSRHTYLHTHVRIIFIKRSGRKRIGSSGRLRTALVNLSAP